MEFKTYLMYVGVMALVTYLVRAVPFAAMNRKITSPFFKSFLAYIPYAVLSAMTVPAIFTATGSVIASTFAFVVAVILAYRKKGLIEVAIFACAAAFVMQALLDFLGTVWV